MPCFLGMAPDAEAARPAHGIEAVDRDAHQDQTLARLSGGGQRERAKSDLARGRTSASTWDICGFVPRVEAEELRRATR